MSVATKFVAKLLEEEEVDIKPVVEEEGVTFIYVKHNNLYRMYLNIFFDVRISDSYIVPFFSSCYH